MCSHALASSGPPLDHPDVPPDEEEVLVCAFCERPFLAEQEQVRCWALRCAAILHVNCVRPHIRGTHPNMGVPTQFQPLAQLHHRLRQVVTGSGRGVFFSIFVRNAMGVPRGFEYSHVAVQLGVGLLSRSRTISTHTIGVSMGCDSIQVAAACAAPWLSLEETYLNSVGTRPCNQLGVGLHRTSRTNPSYTLGVLEIAMSVLNITSGAVRIFRSRLAFVQPNSRSTHMLGVIGWHTVMATCRWQRDSFESLRIDVFFQAYLTFTSQ